MAATNAKAPSKNMLWGGRFTGILLEAIVSILC